MIGVGYRCFLIFKVELIIDFFVLVGRYCLFAEFDFRLIFNVFGCLMSACGVVGTVLMRIVLDFGGASGIEMDFVFRLLSNFNRRDYSYVCILKYQNKYSGNILY